MADNINEWLARLGLGKYSEVFAENDVDFRALAHLDRDDLKELGVSLGHRKIILAAIAALPADAETMTAIPAPSRSPRTDVAPSVVEQSLAERRQLTVMFCDLVGSTALSQSLDPEDLREVMRRYQGAVAGAVARYDGHVAKFLGDGVLAYFGWPRAHEDQAERAVRAGVEAIETVQEVGLDDGARLRARVGIATGHVVVGDLVGDGASDMGAVIGETPNLAARLQSIAEVGQVVISLATRRLIGTAFELKDLGRHDLKGFSEPVSAWSVVGESAAESRFEAAHTGSYIRLVGREHEFGLLQARWDLAKAGESQVVLLSGEAGIGKSRILRELRDKISDERHFLLRYQCSPYHTNSALYPIIRRLEAASQFAAEDTVDVKLDKLERLLDWSGARVAEVAPLFATLLSLPAEERYGALNLTPQQLRARTNEILIEQVLALTQRRPLLFVLEDAHWIDPTTEALIGELMGRARDAAILMLITHRQEYAPPWMAHPHLTSVALSRLGRQHRAEIVRAVGGNELADSTIDRILARSDGVPLYVEELTKSVLEADGQAGDPAAETPIPETLQASLLARLDRLGNAKEVAQIGAAIGREFAYRLVNAVVDLPEAAIDGALEQLIHSELVFCRGTPPEARYRFKHALVQDAAYETLLISRRRQIHRRIAEALQDQQPEIIELEPEILAHHCTAARMWNSAISFWHQAGQRAGRQSANREAVAHYSRGLELLTEVPDDAERNGLELDLQLGLGPSQMALIGWSGLEVRQTYERAQTLCQSAGDGGQRFKATWGLWMHHQGSAAHRQARDLTRQLLDFAEGPESDYSLQAHHATWTTLLYTGELTAAGEHCAKGLALYDIHRHGDHAFSYAGHDPGVCGYAQGALIYWLLGHPAKALKHAEQAEGLADQLEHTGSSAHALNFAARLHSLVKNFEATRGKAEASMALAESVGAAMYIGSSHVLSGWALTHLGDADDGHAQMQEGFAHLDKIGQNSARPHFLALLIDSCIRAGRIDEAARRLREAVELVERRGERYMEAELHRLSGVLAIIAGARKRPIAEAHFSKALAVSRAQGTRSLELRAARDLAELWRNQGDAAKARELLEPVYDGFTEGFDTTDMMEAKALLNELN